MFNKTQEIVTVAVGFLLIGLVVLACVLRIHPIGSLLPDRAEDFNTGWVDEAGIPAAVSGSLGEAGSKVSF